MRYIVVSLVVAALTFSTSVPCEAQRPRATIDSGTVIGLRSGLVDTFKGIPFAAPPLGDLRWRAPQPVAPWSDDFDASHFGHDCMQTSVANDAAALRTTPAEDCLFVNLWRPKGTKSNAKLPVIVWIYGGGFTNGGSSPAVYDGSGFARKGVIMVSFNYRLGRFGFFGHPALTQEDKDGGLLGNYGYLDQIAALKWVQRDIAAFGGDPEKVTVFGESAGGVSVRMLLTSPISNGLFRAAMIESGGGRAIMGGGRFLHTNQVDLPSTETLGINFARKNGISGTDAQSLARLRALPADAINHGLDTMAANGQPDTYAGPMIDGVIVTGAPDDILQAAQTKSVPLIVGATSADSGAVKFATLADAYAAYGEDAQLAQRTYDRKGSADLEQVKGEMGRDRRMIEPARFIARAFASQGRKVYEFRFSYVADAMRAEWKIGAPHASEIPYVMNTVAVTYGAKLSATDTHVADQINTYWANFAKYGDPNGEGQPIWPAYNIYSEKIMEFTPTGVAAASADRWKARLDLAESFSVKLPAVTVASAPADQIYGAKAVTFAQSAKHSVIAWAEPDKDYRWNGLSIVGMPIFVKDNIETLDMPTTAGSLALRNNAPGRDAPVVARLRRAGVVIVGKTNMSEWANFRSSTSYAGWSAVGGQTLNAFDPVRTPCGSSSGSAVAVALNLAPAAIGTETDGSIVCPASVNGVVGFKPTVGLVSRTFVVPISHTQDTPGPIARNVEYAAWLLTAMAGTDPADFATADADRHKTDYAANLDPNSLKGARIGVMRYLLSSYSMQTQATFEIAIETMRKAGATIVDIPMAPVGSEKVGGWESEILATEFKHDVNAYLASTRPDQVSTRSLTDLIAFNRSEPRETVLFGQETFENAQARMGLDNPDYISAVKQARSAAGAYGIDWMLQTYRITALIAPTSSRAATLDRNDDDKMQGSPAQLPAVAGYPHLTVPMGKDRGFPVGLSFIGGKWQDAHILSLGYAFEQANAGPSSTAKPGVY